MYAHLHFITRYSSRLGITKEVTLPDRKPLANGQIVIIQGISFRRFFYRLRQSFPNFRLRFPVVIKDVKSCKNTMIRENRNEITIRL